MVAAETESCDDDEFSVRGEILTKYTDEGTGLTILDVGGIEVMVSPLTDIMFGTLNDLTVGTVVQVSGDTFKDGKLVADKIKIR